MPTSPRPIVKVQPGTKLRYTAQPGFSRIRGQGSGSAADIFYVAYTSQSNSGMAKRPIIFAYNGGPGGSSAGVLVGAFGPRTVSPVEPGHLAMASDQLVDNPDTLLLDADLVFIDPAGAGLSRLVPGTDPTAFYGVRADAAATAAFIAGYLRQHGGLNRQFFIMGESYGTLRTVLTARLLQQQGARPAGLLLMGLILDNATLFIQPGNDEPYWLFLPSEAATARFHGKANERASLPDTVAEAERFAANRYLVALARGSALSLAERAQVRVALTGLLGLQARTERVSPDHFARDLLGGGLIVSRADGRFAGPATGAGPLADPLYATMLPLYGRAMKRYLKEELGMSATADYRVLDTAVADGWQWGDTALGSPNAVSIGGTLREALHDDPALAVFVASGIYDLTSPMLAADYTLTHLDAAPGELARVASHRYESGHMIYVSASSRRQLSHDLAAFVRDRAISRSCDRDR